MKRIKIILVLLMMSISALGFGACAAPENPTPQKSETVNQTMNLGYLEIRYARGSIGWVMQLDANESGVDITCRNLDSSVCTIHLKQDEFVTHKQIRITSRLAKTVHVQEDTCQITFHDGRDLLIYKSYYSPPLY